MAAGSGSGLVPDASSSGPAKIVSPDRARERRGRRLDERTETAGRAGANQYEQTFRPEPSLAFAAHLDDRSQTMPVNEEEKAAKARDAALKGALTQIEREFGKGTVMRMGDEGAQVRVDVIPTGALSLDLALGIGGVPRGRIVEVYGPESSGKTTLIYHVLAEAQKLGGVCAFIDAEHAMDPLYAKEIGVDIDELLVSQPDYGEQGLEIADMLVRSGAVDVVAIDSVAALTPRKELEGQMDDTSVGEQARMMSKAMRKLAGNLNRTQTLCILTNQIREKVGVMFGSPETQPGGRALKFYASQRLDIRRIETLKDGAEAVGNRVRVKVVKNKVAAPFRQAEFDIEFGKGISTSGCLIDIGIEHNIVSKSGSFFSYGEDRLGQGRSAAKAFLDANPKVAKEIERKIYAALGIGPDQAIPIDRDRSEATPSPAPVESEPKKPIAAVA
jgi:recombination protein RecA